MANGAQRLLWLAIWLAVMPTASARFLQADPVGYKDDLDLYFYVHDDPVNQTDPTGMFAHVEVWDDGAVSIDLPIEFNNQSADAGAADAAARNIQTRWSGQFGAFNVVTKVTAVSSADNAKCGCANMVTITDGPAPPTLTPSGVTVDNGGHSYVVGDYEGHWTTMDTKGTPMTSAVSRDLGVASKKSDTSAHEGGHLMNVLDEPGKSGGIMDHGSGVTPSENNIRAVINAPGNTVQHCTRSDGVCAP